jgi:hypothetical protein
MNKIIKNIVDDINADIAKTIENEVRSRCETHFRTTVFIKYATLNASLSMFGDDANVRVSVRKKNKLFNVAITYKKFKHTFTIKHHQFTSLSDVLGKITFDPETLTKYWKGRKLRS